MTNTTHLPEKISSNSNSDIRTTRPLSQEQITRYHEDGFVIVPGFFDPEEVEPVRKACEADPEVKGSQTRFADGDGNLSQIAFWSDLSDSLLGVIPRLARIVDAAEELIGGECYHWHSKLVKKDPHSEGRFEWHQEYGAWYHDGCLFPDIVGCFIAIDQSTPENGCLQIIKKSHLMGRIDHPLIGGSIMGDPKRMAKILERLEVVYCEMEPGDAMFMHANTLHASGGNHTNRPRTNIICHYNAASNEPVWLKDREHRRYCPLQKLPDSTIIDGNYSSVFDQHEFIPPTKVSTTMLEYSEKPS